MSSEAHLEVRFRRRIGSLALDVSFTTAAPWTILFGPSGSGKSSILRVIAGFETPLDPTTFVRIADTVVHNRETGVYIPAWRRNIRLAAQKVALYSHMTVEQNLAFGLEAEAAGLTGRGLIDEVGRALELFQLQALAGKKPRELSGGESQKVAIVRAAIGAPGKLLLLDEPFAGLDVRVRDQLITDLRSWLGATPILSVTHDVGEAFFLGAEVVRINAGRVVAQGPVATVLAEERISLRGLLD